MHSPDNKKLIVIAGPTAVGKTAVSISVARALHTSIISADSRQCYQDMTIGTAKPSPSQLAQVPHYFIDQYPVTEHITAADFESLALNWLDQLFAICDYAVVAGGTGLYIKALCEGLDEMPAVDELIAQEVNRTYRQKGLPWLQEALSREDPLFYRNGEISNPARLLRALIFKRSSGRSLIEYRTHTVKQRPFDILKIGLGLPREVLYERISRRVDLMMEQGLLQEAERLYPFKDLKNLQTVGYAELFEYMDGRCSLAAAVDKIRQHTRNYAKRQMTWFKKDREITWLQADSPALVEQLLSCVRAGRSLDQ